MTSPQETKTSEPPVDRSTGTRWGCIAVTLVVGVLGGITLLTIVNSARLRGSTPASTLQASGIFKAMMLYAQDHDGKFPTSNDSSNEAFRKLFPEYMEDEKSFFVPNSAWHDAARGHRTDGDIGSQPDFAQCLERGENHWAYVSGLDEKTRASTPVIADGFVENQPGTYTDDPAKKGGVWKGQKAIVVFMDGSARSLPLSPKTHFRVLLPDPTSRQPVDIFTRKGGLPENARVLNPAK